MDPITIATFTMMSAKMAVNLGQRIAGIDDAKEAVKQARKNAAELNSLMGVRAAVRTEQTLDLVGAQRVAVAQAGLASSSGAVGARNRAMLQLQREIRADQIQTAQRVRELMDSARAGVKTARQDVAFGTINEAMGVTSSAIVSGRQRRDEIAGQTELRTQPKPLV